MSSFLHLFDAGPAVVVTPPAARARAPRRPRASVLFDGEARIAGLERFAWRPGESLAEFTLRTSGRRVRREELPKDVRMVKGGAYQSRPWIGPARDANVNLGLFHPEEYGNDRDAAISAAARAAREFKKAMAYRGSDIWDVIQQLQRTTRFGLPVVPVHVLPPLVRRQGERFVVRGRLETFDSAGAAWEMARRVFLARAQNVTPSRIAA